MATMQTANIKTISLILESRQAKFIQEMNCLQQIIKLFIYLLFTEGIGIHAT